MNKVEQEVNSAEKCEQNINDSEQTEYDSVPSPVSLEQCKPVETNNCVSSDIFPQFPQSGDLTNYKLIYTC